MSLDFDDIRDTRKRFNHEVPHLYREAFDAMLDEVTKPHTAALMLLGKEVYDFLVEAADTDCPRKRVLGGPPCGTCIMCKAKVLEEKVRLKHVQLGWKLDPCKACKGSGTQDVVP